MDHICVLQFTIKYIKYLRFSTKSPEIWLVISQFTEHWKVKRRISTIWDSQQQLSWRIFTGHRQTLYLDLHNNIQCCNLWQCNEKWARNELVDGIQGWLCIQPQIVVSRFNCIESTLIAGSISQMHLKSLLERATCDMFPYREWDLWEVFIWKKWSKSRQQYSKKMIKVVLGMPLKSLVWTMDLWR